MSSTAAAAAIGLSSFSPSIHTLNCNRFKNSAIDNCFLKFPSIRSIPSLSHSFCAGAKRWCILKASADVAQEEPTVEEEQNGAEEAATRDSTRLYIGNLAYSIDSAKLAELIQDIASPESIEVIYDKASGKSRGFAFVTMSSIEDCNAVIENLNGRMHLGRPLRVNMSDKPQPKQPLYPETEHKLFVWNLSGSVTVETLTKAFEDCGNVVGARVVYDGETGNSKGYGFVCYSTKSEMDVALETLNGLDLDGREIGVSVAQGKRS